MPVLPGSEATAEISVTNTGPVVDSFTLEVLGPAGAWASCEPESLSLFPGQSGTARVLFRPPPGSAVPLGRVVYAVRVRSAEDPAGSVVEEGAVDVGALPVVQAELSPRTGRARGRRTSRHRVAVDNLGNAPVVVQLIGRDEDDVVDVVCDPPELEVGPDSAVFAKVRVRGRHRFWTGASQTHRFQVLAQPPGAAPVAMRGTLLQEAVLPRWLPKALLALAAAAVALAVLWFTVLSPVVKSAATDAGAEAAHQELNKALQSAQQGSGGGAGSGSGSGSGKGTGTSPSPSSGASSSSAPSPSPVIALPPPVPLAVELDSHTTSVTAAAKHQLSITDLVLQNPAGDKGSLTISVGGKVLLNTRLNNFRDYDLPFVTPIAVAAGQTLQLKIGCENPGGAPCTPAVLVNGTDATTAF
ncbi:hypothetical protein AB0K51_01230 [Kitasatospora sp. NPDC049285]|uniref:COG1470 family protein n=1 Tax=Kitasatospora sp. NPDC049285 TaxID=3157096 RepID=UPI00341BE128